MTTNFVAGLILSAALVISPFSASAQIAVPSSGTTAKAATAEEASGKVEPVQEKKICKQLPSSNSRLPNRVCLTEKQWRQVEQEAQ